jgi:hypothetical protein
VRFCDICLRPDKIRPGTDFVAYLNDSDTDVEENPTKDLRVKVDQHWKTLSGPTAWESKGRRKQAMIRTIKIKRWATRTHWHGPYSRHKRDR